MIYLSSKHNNTTTVINLATHTIWIALILKLKTISNKFKITFSNFVSIVNWLSSPPGMVCHISTWTFVARFVLEDIGTYLLKTLI